MNENYPLYDKCNLDDFPLDNKIVGYLRLKKGDDMTEEQCNQKVGEEVEKAKKQVFAHVFNAFFSTYYGRSMPNPEVDFKNDVDYWYAQNNIWGIGDWISNQVNEKEFQAKWVRSERLSKLEKQVSDLDTINAKVADANFKKVESLNKQIEEAAAKFSVSEGARLTCENELKTRSSVVSPVLQELTPKEHLQALVTYITQWIWKK
jgi:hypothetical protein